MKQKIKETLIARPGQQVELTILDQRRVWMALVDLHHAKIIPTRSIKPWCLCHQRGNFQNP
jgi:hypothetical protein